MVPPFLLGGLEEYKEVEGTEGTEGTEKTKGKLLSALSESSLSSLNFLLLSNPTISDKTIRAVQHVPNSPNLRVYLAY